METSKIRALLAAVDLGSFSKAAELLGYTQSGITHMMNSLEEELGVPLLVRGNRGVRLSADGERLEPQLRRLAADAERLEQEIALTRGVESGLVRIGTYSSISLHWLPQILELFQERYPGIDVELLEGDGQEMTSWLSSGRIDLAFMSLQPGHSSFETIKIKDDPMLAVLPKSHPMAGEKVFPFERFKDERYLVYLGLSGPDEDLARAMRMAGIGSNARFTSNFDMNIISMVEHNLGVTILPELILQGAGDNVAILPLDPPISRTLAMAMRPEGGASPAMRRFIGCAREVLGL